VLRCQAIGKAAARCHIQDASRINLFLQEKRPMKMFVAAFAVASLLALLALATLAAKSALEWQTRRGVRRTLTLDRSESEVA